MDAKLHDEWDGAIAGEKRRLLEEGTPADALGSLGAVAVVTLASWQHADHARIAGWIATMALPLLLQLATPRLARGASDARFLAGYAMLALVLGLAWATCSLWIRPDDFRFEAFVVLALCVIFTAGSVFNAHHLPMMYGLLFAGLGPLAALYAARGGIINWCIAAGFAILMWTLVGYGRAFHRGMVRAVVLGRENARLVDELTAKAQELQEANAAKSRFLASASHDLRQPLHALSLLAGVLDERAKDHGLEDLSSRIAASTAAMEALLNGILDLSRLDAGIERPQPMALCARALLERVERQFAPIAAARGLRLRVRASAGEHWVRSDGALLMRMLDNLVSNALRYTRDGGVLVAARRRGDALLLEVFDTGVGIPPDQQERVFHEFVQLHNPQRDRAQGLGLGLSIVRRTADLLEHRLELRSTPGRGSLFRLHLPRVERPAALTTPTLAAWPSTVVAGLCVLVVDDEAPIRDALQDLLQAWDCDGLVAAGGDEALATIAGAVRPPDALLCDYRFAGETGVEVVARVREALGAEVPALIVTGDVTTAQLIDIATNELQVLHKPVNPAVLRQWLGTVVQARGVFAAAP